MLCVLFLYLYKNNLIISRDGTNLGKKLEERHVALREQEGKNCKHSLEERSSGERGWTAACVRVKEAGHGSTGVGTGSSSHPMGPVPSAQCQDSTWVGNGKCWRVKQTVEWNQPFSWGVDPWFSNFGLSGPPSCSANPSACSRPSAVTGPSPANAFAMKLFPGFFISSLKVAQNHFNFWRSHQNVISNSFFSFVDTEDLDSKSMQRLHLHHFKYIPRGSVL